MHSRLPITFTTPTSTMTLREAADVYLQWFELEVKKGKRDPQTLYGRRSALEFLGGPPVKGKTIRQWVEATGYAIADILVGELKRSQIINWLDAVALIPGETGEPCVTRDNHALKGIRALLNWCANRDACIPSLASRITTEYEPPPGRALNRQELECYRAVLRAREPRNDLLCLRVIADNGARPGEVRLARGSHFKLTEGVLRWPKGKNGKPRVIVLSPVSLEIIRPRARGEELLFPSHELPNQPYTGQHLNRLAKEIARDADIENPEEISLKTFRKSFATIAYEEGASLDDVMRSLSHEDRSITIRYYLQNAVDPGARRVNRIINTPRECARRATS